MILIFLITLSFANLSKYNAQIDNILTKQRKILKTLSDEAINGDYYLNYVNYINKFEKMRLKKFEQYLQHRKPFDFMKIGQIQNQGAPVNKFDAFMNSIKSGNDYLKIHNEFVQEQAIKDFNPTVKSNNKLITAKPNN